LQSALLPGFARNKDKGEDPVVAAAAREVALEEVPEEDSSGAA